MDFMNTTYRIASKSCTNRGCKTFVGRARYYENKRFIFSESTGIHRLNPIDAQVDAYRVAMERLHQD